MTPAVAAQFVLEYPTHPEAQPRARKRRTRALSAVPGVSYTEPTLTPDAATAQARAALKAAGLMAQVSRVVSSPSNHLPDSISTIALLRVGADPNEVGCALSVLPGADIRCGTAMVAVYRSCR